MSAARLHPLCLHAALALMIAGLMLSTFVGAHRIGMVIACLGLVAYGGALVATYLAWETGE